MKQTFLQRFRARAALRALVRGVVTPDQTHPRARPAAVSRLNDMALAPGFLRITTALPKDKQRVIDTLHALLT